MTVEPSAWDPLTEMGVVDSNMGVVDSNMVVEHDSRRKPFPNRRCAHFAPSVVNRSLQGLCRDGSSETSMPGVASDLRVREVADPKCRCAGAGRPRWILETPRSALPDPPQSLCQRRAHRQR